MAARFVVTRHSACTARLTDTRAGERVAILGPTDEVLGDTDLLAAHALELPHGFAMNHH